MTKGAWAGSQAFLCLRWPWRLPWRPVRCLPPLLEPEELSLVNIPPLPLGRLRLCCAIAIPGQSIGPRFAKQKRRVSVGANVGERFMKNTPPLNSLKVLMSGNQQPSGSPARGSFDMASKFLAHGREDLFGEGMLLPRTETRVKRRRKDVHGNRLFQGRHDGPTTLS
jgi:hypothetical protein